MIDSGDAEIGDDGSEGVVGDLGSCGGDDRKEGRLAGVGQTDEANVCEELQLYLGFVSFAWLTDFGDDGGLADTGLEMSIAEAAVTAARYDSGLTVDGEVGDNFAVFPTNGADRYVDDEIGATMA